ncbi:hypothetical protein K490DRAFT_59975 [Saccharata proteae CBS 121410]|uniref:Carrier domain-containing protein n=1 Tax=Saccharata proteae CBS 121410 TaxID=1314787 RepID=A0A9P4HQC0_9PEZI|nr:hypothetical protein K490DRAFT_59975 [Saccharata proteae CBS 121410]
MNGQEASPKIILVFGPQALNFNQDAFRKLRDDIVNSSTLSWAHAVIAKLADHFDEIRAEFSKLAVVDGAELLRNLKDWLDTGNLGKLAALPHIPNINLTPLCVISQLGAYSSLEKEHDDWRKNTETVGFCTDLLAALAVSLSANETDLAVHGATALRVAMLIGAVVDAQDALEGESKSFSVVWKTPEDYRSGAAVLHGYPEFPDASELVLPCRSDVTDDGDFITTGKLSTVALKAMLIEPSKWWMTFKSFCSAGKDPATIVTLGPERCSPPSLVRELPSGFQLQQQVGFSNRPLADNPNDIAIIGMSCKVAGADDVDEFWDVLRKGESQHTEVPESRLNFETAFRDFDKQKWYGNFYPSISQKTPIDDIVKLQLTLFALQYASAKSWIDCGVQPSALVGHSFGELTALCVSGILSIQDTIRMIAGRARIIRDEWGPEKGAMMAVEGDLDQVERLLAQSKTPTDAAANIACINGPRSFTLAGSARAIDAVERKVAADAAYSSMRVKKLNVSNAFHSTLVQDLMSSLKNMAKDLTFNKAVIPVESASKTGHSGTLSPIYVAEHMRNPVYFHQAVQRLSEEHGSCVWLEAGSRSNVTSMVNRALSAGNSSSHTSASHFQALSITSESSISHQLTSATLVLWKAGLNTQQYAPIILPPYQFEKSRHWLELKVPPKVEAQVAAVEEPRGLWTFEGYQDAEQHSARFRVLTDAAEYREMVSSHKIAQTAPICPATLEVDMAIEALRSLDSRFRNSDIEPQILGVENHAPICLDSLRIVRIEFAALDTNSKPCYQWSWKMTSESMQKDANPTIHVAGQIIFCSTDSVQFQREFARYERLVSHERCLDLLHGDDADDDVVRGPTIYRIFDEVVEYGKRYQGLQRLVGMPSRNESAGRVVKKYTGKTWLDAHLSDCFSQVGGIWVNCMTGKETGEMYFANGFEKWFRSPKLGNDDSRPETWDVLACHDKGGNSAFTTDIFVFDPRGGVLIEAILGIYYAKVPKLSMSKLLARLTKDVEIKVTTNAAQELQVKSAPMTDGHISAGGSGPQKASSGQDGVAPKVRAILADLSGLDAEDIKDDSDLIELGIDSLVGMELSREIEGAYDCHLATVELVKLTSVNSLVQYIQGVLGPVGDDSSDDSSESLALSGDEKVKSTAQTSAANNSPASDDECRTMKLPNGVKGVVSWSKGSKHVLDLPSSVVVDAFSESKALTDRFIEGHMCDGYLETVLPIQNELCVALTLEAFKKLGCDLETAKPGQILERISHIATLDRLADYLYEMLREAGLIKKTSSQFIRTTVDVPKASSAEILHLLLRKSPQHSYPHKLVHFAESSLADVLTGESDGIKMQDFVRRLVSRLPNNDGPLKILELGAGTGGTTRWIVPLLASLDIPVEYTFSDLAPSFVATARKRFGKEYPFMRFRTVDIEKDPSEDLLSSQHMVLVSSAIHATHSLTQSLGSMRKLLRPDGFVMMLEMTKTLFWVDMIFGLLEGWWLFDDGRRHAIAHQSRSSDRLPSSDVKARQVMVDKYVEKQTQDFSVPLLTTRQDAKSDDFCVLVTGATGSLGSHIVTHLAGLPEVKTVVCLNRRANADPHTPGLLGLEVVETASSKPMLGVKKEQYDELAAKVTHIVHNAWPMSGKRPLKGFEGQFKVMRNLIDFTSTCATTQGSKVGFEFVSSIAVVGHYPIHTGNVLVPEERIMTVEDVLSNDYSDAKWVCERMLDETLHQYPRHFAAKSHFSFMVKSSQTLKAFPRFDVLAEAIGADIIPFNEWVQRVRTYPGPVEWENPAAKLTDFFDHDYTRPVEPDVVRKTVQSGSLAWDMIFH